MKEIGKTLVFFAMIGALFVAGAFVSQAMCSPSGEGRSWHTNPLWCLPDRK